MSRSAIDVFSRLARDGDGDPWISEADGAEQLGCISRHINERIKPGTLAAIKCHAANLIRTSNIDALVESRAAA